MPRGGNRCTHRQKRYEILDLLVDCATRCHGSLPGFHSAWVNLVKPRLGISYSVYRQHMNLLEDEGHVAVIDGCMLLVQSEWQYLDPATGDYREPKPFVIPIDSEYARRRKLYLKRRIFQKKKTAANYRARKLKVKGKIERTFDLVQMRESQGNKCWWCGAQLQGETHLDHRVPLAKGGSNDVSNLCLSCPDCNIAKGDKMPWEFNGRLL